MCDFWGVLYKMCDAPLAFTRHAVKLHLVKLKSKANMGTSEQQSILKE